MVWTAALTLRYQRPSFCLSIFFSLLNYNLVLSPFIYHTLSVGVFFFLGIFFCLPPSLLSLSLFSPSSLIFYFTLASVFFKQLVFGSAPSSNMQYILKELRSHVFNLKAPKSSVSGTATVFLSLFPSIQRSITFLPNQNVVC